MPAAALFNPADVKWMVGYLFGTIAGSQADDVPFGELQEVTLKDALSLRELMGVSSLGAVAVGVTERKISGTARFAKIRARQFYMARGGTPPGVQGGTTLWTAQLTDEPSRCSLHLKSPSDGSQLELKLYGVVIPEFEMPMKLRDFVVASVTFHVYGDGLAKFYDLILPGDQTTS